MDEYQYKTLPGPDYIRILTVHPATDPDANIDCKVEAARLSNSHYDALSYSWGMNEDGEASLSRSILVNGKASRVPRNLFEGLRRIREAENPVRLWIDAVCINQSDQPERNAQVARMADIYRNSQRVIIWPGEGLTKEDDLATMALLESIDRHIDICSCHLHVDSMRNRRCILACILRESMKCDCERYSQDGQSVKSRADPSDWYHFAGLQRSVESILEAKGSNLAAGLGEALKPLSIFRRRYWSRRWIVQEIYHSKAQLWYWGPCHRDVTGLMDQTMSILARLFAAIHAVVESLGARLETQRKQWWDITLRTFKISHLDPAAHSSANNSSLASLLRDFSSYECQDPRNRLFALLSLCKGSSVLPDYELSYGQTAVVCTELLIKEGNVQNWLCTLGERGENTSQSYVRPSWAVDLLDDFTRSILDSSELIERPVIDAGVLTCRVRNFGIIDPDFYEEHDAFRLMPDESAENTTEHDIHTGIKAAKRSILSKLRGHKKPKASQLSTELARSANLKRQAAPIRLHRASYCREDPRYDPDLVQKLRSGDLMCSFYSSKFDTGSGPVGYLAILRPTDTRPQTYRMLFTFEASTLYAPNGKRIQATNLYFSVRTVHIV